MKKSDLILPIIAFAILLTLVGSSWMIMLKLGVGVLLLGVVLHWKVTPYKAQLTQKYVKIYNVFDSVFRIAFQAFNKVPNIQLGNRIQLDSSYVIIISLLTIILIIL